MLHLVYDSLLGSYPNWLYLDTSKFPLIELLVLKIYPSPFPIISNSRWQIIHKLLPLWRKICLNSIRIFLCILYRFLGFNLHPILVNLRILPRSLIRLKFHFQCYSRHTRWFQWTESPPPPRFRTVQCRVYGPQGLTDVEGCPTCVRKIPDRHDLWV